jgi:hypothetical protein
LVSERVGPLFSGSFLSPTVDCQLLTTDFQRVVRSSLFFLRGSELQLRHFRSPVVIPPALSEAEGTGVADFLFRAAVRHLGLRSRGTAAISKPRLSPMCGQPPRPPGWPTLSSEKGWVRSSSPLSSRPEWPTFSPVRAARMSAMEWRDRGNTAKVGTGRAHRFNGWNV